MKWFDRISAALEKETLERRERYFKTSLINYFQLAMVLTVAGIVVWFFSTQISYYFHWHNQLNGKPGVYNLTQAGLEWDVFYGESPTCGKIDCHLKKNYPAKNFHKKMVLPAREFPLKDYKAGQTIYLRSQIKIPAELKDYNHLHLYSIYIWAKHYEVYLNENLMATGTKETFLISIPPNQISKDQTVDVALKINPGDLPYQGLANRLDLYIGAKESMGRALHSSFEYQTVYYLWYLIPRLLIGFIFAILFTAVYRHREIAIFVLYTLFSCIGIFLNTAFVPEPLQKLVQGETTYLVFDCVAQLLLLIFVHEYFRRSSKFFNYIFTCLASLTITFSMLYLLSEEVRSYLLQSNIIYYLRESIRITAIAYGSIIGILTTLYLRATRKSSFRYYSCAIMSIFFLLSTFYLSIDFLSKSYASYGVARLVFELILYVNIAVIVAAEFGVALTQRDFIKTALGRYLDDRVVDEMIREKNTLPLEERELTVMFCDIRSFTTLAEILSEKDLALLIQEFREMAVECIKGTGGYIDKFIGDGFMAIWGAPIRIPNHQRAACEAALQMRKKLIEFNTHRTRRNLPQISMGMGIDSGTVLIGEIQSFGKAEYSVFGDTVNIASRLQDYTKEVLSDCIISGQVYDAIKDHACCEDLNKIQVKGKNSQIHAYKLVGLFNQSGAFYSNYPIWDMELAGKIKPGLTNKTGSNLKLFNYDHFRKKAA